MSYARYFKDSTRPFGWEIGLGAERYNFVWIAYETFSLQHTPNGFDKSGRPKYITSVIHFGLFYRIVETDFVDVEIGVRHDLMSFPSPPFSDSIYFPSFTSVGVKAMVGSEWLRIGVRMSGGLMQQNSLGAEFVVLFHPTVRFKF